MTGLSLIVNSALGHGLILSLLLSLVIFGSFAVNPEVWLNDYPPDIRNKFGPMSQKARRQRIPFAVLFLAISLGTVIVGFARVVQWLGGDAGALEAFIYAYLVFQVFNLIDLLVLDWLIFVRWQPKFVVLPGTEGLAGYKDYGFHFRGFLVGLAIGAVGAAAFAGGLMLWRWIAG